MDSNVSPSWRLVGDAVAALEDQAAHWLQQMLEGIPYDPPPGPAARQVLDQIEHQLWPRLQLASQEITYLLHGLNGGYVPSGPSGAPTRGRWDVLPTGRNFYSVDIRAVPTETAWQVGLKAADAVIEQYMQEQGTYPRTLGLSVWGTSTMRTGGDDWAEAMALIGVQPVWDPTSRRVVDFEILPLSWLNRPRVDVTLRISGFFRDAFPNLISLFDQAVQAVAECPESPESNPIRARMLAEQEHWEHQGLTPTQARIRSRYRIFGSKPGAYGAGLQGLIEGQNWTSDADLAQAYLNWSSYAYTGQGQGHAAPEALRRQLADLQIVLHNQDNREHDLLDSDDYYQFQGGMIAAVRTLSGTHPQAYFGDHSRPQVPRVHRLAREIAKVYRSRVINPRWIAGVMRHGYKGAFEMAATLDYLFAYDATAQCIEDFMYDGIVAAYLQDPQVHSFIQQHNPWALRDMSERLLEAHQRSLWQPQDPDMLPFLESMLWSTEADLEQKVDRSMTDKS